MQAVPPHVQLDLLAETWHRHVAKQSFTATALDEAVIYAACETAARIVEHEPEVVSGYLRGGPLFVEARPSDRLAADLRALHLRLSNDGDFLMISQFEDIPPHEARRRAQDDITRWIAGERRILSVAGRFPLEDCAGAHELVEAGGKVGTVVVEVS